MCVGAMMAAAAKAIQPAQPPTPTPVLLNGRLVFHDRDLTAGDRDHLLGLFAAGQADVLLEQLMVLHTACRWSDWWQQREQLRELYGDELV